MPIRARSSLERESTSVSSSVPDRRRGKRSKSPEGRSPPLRSSEPDTAAIEAARARAVADRPAVEIGPKPIRVIDTNTVPESGLIRLTLEEQKEWADRPILEQGAGLAGAMAYLGYKTASATGWKSLKVVDWIARGMDRLGDKLISKKIPFLKWIINPLATLCDKTSKWLGLDKTTLAEHLKKNAEDRKKLAEKLRKELRDTESKFERKLDDAAKKKKRKEKLTKKFGKELADVLEDEFEEQEKTFTSKSEEPKSEPEPAKTAEPKAA